MDKFIGVVIVLYHSFEQNWTCLLGQKNIRIYIVDNTPDRNLMLTGKQLFYTALGDNYGIAAAQNIGIKQALSDGCQYVVFFDQDSVFDSDYIRSLLIEYKRINLLYPYLAILGPSVLNKDTGLPYKVENSDIQLDCRKLSFVISSGAMVKASVFSEVGLMEESLFIDCVDFEWCWRAISKGYICCGTLRVTMNHKVGNVDSSFFGYPIIVSAPIRYYYQYRNYLWLFRRKYVPTKWKMTSGVRKIHGLLWLPFTPGNKRQILKYMLRGISDGLRGR